MCITDFQITARSIVYKKIKTTLNKRHKMLENENEKKHNGS